MKEWLARALVELAPAIAGLLAEAFQHPDPSAAIERATARLAAERGSQGLQDAAIAARDKAGP